MIDPKRLDAALEELYAVDPSLRAQGPSLRKLAEELLASKPDVRIDETFVARLRSELTSRAAVRPSWSFAGFLRSRNAMFLVPGLAVLALVAVVTVDALPHPQATAPAVRGLALATGVEHLGADAFGTLSAQPTAPSQSGNAPQNLAFDSHAAVPTAGTAAPMAPAVAPAPMTAPAALPPNAGGGGGTVGNAKMMMPIDWTPTVYKYVYKGDPIEGLTDHVDVYRRETVSAGAGPVQALSAFNLGLIDLGKLKDASVQSYTLSEGGQDGYVVSVDPQQGMITINENGNWSYPERQCADQACLDRYRLKESDMLSDDAAIGIADGFLDQMGVSKAGYGTPVVRDDWRVNYLATTDKTDFYFPDTVSVIYPYLIDGKSATDESGAPYGLNVNVNVAHKRASGLWNLTVARFQSSSYAAETDAKRLIGIAEQGGVNGGGMIDGAKVVEVDLGTPTVAYSRVWQWNAEGGTELFAPTLVFPIQNAPKDSYLTNVLVPLEQDLLKQADQPKPVPMPMIENR